MRRPRFRFRHRPQPTVAGGLGALALGWAVGSPALAAGVPVALACAWHWRRERAPGVDRHRTMEATIAVVEGLVQQLKGGRSLAQALRSVVEQPLVQAPGRTELSPLFPVLLRLRAGLDAGTGLEVALARAAGWAAAGSRGGDQGLRLTLATLTVLVQRGGPALPALERLDDTLRSARSVEQEVQVQAGQATASALALAGLPALFVVALALLDDDLARFYWFEPAGALCLIGSGLLSYLGWIWMHRIVTGAT